MSDIPTQHIAALQQEIRTAVLNTPEAQEHFYRRFLGRKSILREVFTQMAGLDGTQRKALGESINLLKKTAQERFDQASPQQKKPLAQEVPPPIDMTLPAGEGLLGGRHPLAIVEEEVIDSFQRLGFQLWDGPEIEDDWHNFGALHFGKYHPARDMQDTFFLVDGGRLLRTHTTSVQVRALEEGMLPLRMVSCGRVYRNEAISARSHCLFHQLDGVYVNQKVTYQDLQEVLYAFVESFFGKQAQVRIRASYFPFTTPSVEVDISCRICNHKGCSVCKGSGWVEILGAGMVHPEVLRNCNLDPNVYKGFALGMGMERLAMLKYQVDDLRLFWSNDIAFLKQFRWA